MLYFITILLVILIILLIKIASVLNTIKLIGIHIYNRTRQEGDIPIPLDIED